MKNVKLWLFPALLACIVYFTGCSKNVNISTEAQSKNEFLEPLFQLDDLNAIENPDILEADEKTEFGIRDSAKHNPLKPCERPVHHESKDCKPRKDKRGCKERKEHPQDKDPKNLPFILKQLKLDSAQVHSIRGFMKDYCDCLADHHSKAHETNRNILKRANHQRHVWLADFREGKITREQLLEKLAGLHKKVKGDLRDDESKREHMAIMRKCREGLFRQISTVLDSAQKDKFHNWLQQHK